MMSIISGVVILGAGGGGLWLMIPRNGVPHPLAKVPFLDSLIPITIVAALAVGVALVINGFA
jgi:hypothetical protein